MLAGTNITYTLTVTNNGPSDATGVSLSDAIPAGTIFLADDGIRADLVADVRCVLSPSTSGANKSVTLVVKVDSSRTTNISNTASTTSGVFDPDTSEIGRASRRERESISNVALT